MAKHHLIALGTFILFIYVKTQTTKPIFPVSCYLNVLIILDRSDSVKGGFNRSRDFVVNVSEELNIGPNAHRVALIVYSGLNYRREVFKWNFAKNNEEFRKAVHGLRAIGGTTNTKKALEIGLNLMQTRNTSIPTLIMVVTDGRSADDPKLPAKQLQEIPKTWVFAAATGNPQAVDKQELLEITGDINHVILQSGRQLAADITRRLLRQAQEKCRTTTTSTTTTTTTTTITTTTTNPVSGCEQDIVLVIDLSTTTTPVYRYYIDMAVQLVRRLLIGYRYSRIALITFSSVGKTRTQFNLNRYFEANQIENAIRRIESTGGTTAVGEGIRLATEQQDARNGGRPINIAGKVMIVFTDGWSNKGPDPEIMSQNAKRAGFVMYTVAYEGNGGLDAGNAGLNLYTVEAVANDVRHVYTEHNFTQLVEELRRRNLPCF